MNTQNRSFTADELQSLNTARDALMNARTTLDAIGSQKLEAMFGREVYEHVCDADQIVRDNIGNYIIARLGQAFKDQS